MSIEVPCPQCGSMLRAPAGSAGRKARCKKCQHGFRLPGVAAEEAGQESAQLSVVDAPAFTFDATAEAGEPVAESRKSHAKYKSSMKSSVRSRGAEKGQRGPGLILFGLGAVLIAGGVAAYFFANPSKPPEQIASAAPASPPKGKEKAVEPVTDKDPAKKLDTARAGSPLAKGVEKRPGKTPVVTGGLKLPAPPTKAESMTKPLVQGSVEIEYGKIRQFFASAGENPVAAIVWASEAGFQGQGVKDTVDRYSLTSGERIDRTLIEVDNSTWPRACDLSPGGDHFITEGPKGTLTLYDLNAKAKAGTPFKPFAGNPEVPTAALAAAMFADEKLVLVAAVDGRVESWNANDGTRVGSGSVGAATLSARCCAMKLDRSAMLIVAGAALHEVPAATLIAKSTLNLPHGGGEGLAIAVDNSDRIAVAYRAASPGPHTRLVVARSGESKPSADLHFDDSLGSIDTLAWCGPEALTLGFDKSAALLFDTEDSKPIAALWPQPGPGRHLVAGSKHCVLMVDPADAKKCLLVGIDFPPNDYLPLKNEAIADRKPVAFVITGEGFGR